MSAEQSPVNDATALRKSRCAAQSRQQETARLRRMSIEERVRSALEMDKRFSWIKPDRMGPAR
jgi:hypothetical protein